MWPQLHFRGEFGGCWLGRGSLRLYKSPPCIPATFCLRSRNKVWIHQPSFWPIDPPLFRTPAGIQGGCTDLGGWGLSLCLPREVVKPKGKGVWTVGDPWHYFPGRWWILRCPRPEGEGGEDCKGMSHMKCERGDVLGTCLCQKKI